MFLKIKNVKISHFNITELKELYASHAIFPHTCEDQNLQENHETSK